MIELLSKPLPKVIRIRRNHIIFWVFSSWGGDILRRIEKSIEINAPREKVWEMLALDRWPEWMDGWKGAEYTSEVRKPKDKYRVGSSAHITEHRARTRTKYDFEITESLENEKITFRSESMGYTLITYILESAEEGTKLTYAIDYEMPWGILGKFLDKLGHRSGEKIVEKELKKLKSILEK